LSTSTKLKRPGFIEDLMSTGPKHEQETENAEGSPKPVRTAILTPMLDIVFRDGIVESLSYAYLKRVRFVPGDTLELRFASGETVVIEGRGLEPYRKQIRLHRADEVRECSETELQSQDKGISQVERIHITEGDTR
jgi:hypothetical protein